MPDMIDDRKRAAFRRPPCETVRCKHRLSTARGALHGHL